MNLNDLGLLALTVYGEARGEPPQGQIAVAQVILERDNIRGTSVAQEVLRPLQFSCWNQDDPNYPLLQAIKQGGPISDTSFFSCASNAAMAYITPSLMPGATCYFNPSVVTPEWAAKMKYVGRIGNHVFYA